MAFVYDIAPTGTLTGGTANTETAVLQILQGGASARGVDIQAYSVAGRASALTTINGIAFRAKRWTTQGSGGGACTVSPRRIGTTAATSAKDNSSALTPGTVSGAIQLMFGCGAGGPGGWAAMNPDSMIHIEGASADEVTLYSISGLASATFDLGAEIAE